MRTRDPLVEEPYAVDTHVVPERILLIDDDVTLCRLVSQYLTGEGFQTDTAQSGEQGLKQALAGKHALIVLDVMMPGMNGFEVLRRIRAESLSPVLMLTAKGDSLDRVLGLEMGADDYLSKPFDPKELAARIRAILRRTKRAAMNRQGQRSAQLVLDDITLDASARTVRRNGEPVNLTTVEFDLLETLIRAAGKAIDRESLSRNVLGREFSPFDRSIDTHVCNLRKKLGPLADGTERIKGIRGLGYLYAVPSGTERV